MFTAVDPSIYRHCSERELGPSTHKKPFSGRKPEHR